MNERAKYTMRDVARLAGVSTSTVSGVINESVVVSPERKARVLAAMAALDYHPDAIARSLKTGRSNAVGVVVPDITNAFYPEVIRGIEETAQAAGYSVLLCELEREQRGRGATSRGIVRAPRGWCSFGLLRRFQGNRVDFPAPPAGGFYRQGSSHLGSEFSVQRQCEGGAIGNETPD